MCDKCTCNLYVGLKHRRVGGNGGGHYWYSGIEWCIFIYDNLFQVLWAEQQVLQEYEMYSLRDEVIFNDQLWKEQWYLVGTKDAKMKWWLSFIMKAKFYLINLNMCRIMSSITISVSLLLNKLTLKRYISKIKQWVFAYKFKTSFN